VELRGDHRQREGDRDDVEGREEISRSDHPQQPPLVRPDRNPVQSRERTGPTSLARLALLTVCGDWHSPAGTGATRPAEGLLSPRRSRSGRSGVDAVIFDLDGVLVDSEAVWDDARHQVVDTSGGRWKPEATGAMMGMSSPEWSRYLRDELAVPLECDEINARVVELVLASYRRDVPLLPGAVATVIELASHWPLGLASSANRPVIDAVLATAGLTASFAVSVSGDEVARGKPAPDVYLATARKLEVDPARAAAVEDSTNGLRAAAAAGLIVIAVPNRQFPPTADSLSLAALTVEAIGELTPAAIQRAAR
jgi:HAD superfamily hydrolase (TIGR01509 family)